MAHSKVLTNLGKLAEAFSHAVEKVLWSDPRMQRDVFSLATAFEKHLLSRTSGAHVMAQMQPKEMLYRANTYAALFDRAKQASVTKAILQRLLPQGQSKPDPDVVEKEVGLPRSAFADLLR